MTHARLFSLAGFSAGLCLLAGCASTEPAPATDKYLVSAASAQFYKYGPAQAFGADFNLNQGQKVTMLKREFGYSQILLADGTTGYIATEELKPAPPEPPPPRPAPQRALATGSSGRPAKKPKRSYVPPVTADPTFDINDVPLPLPD